MGMVLGSDPNGFVLRQVLKEETFTGNLANNEKRVRTPKQ